MTISLGAANPTGLVHIWWTLERAGYEPLTRPFFIEVQHFTDGTFTDGYPDEFEPLLVADDRPKLYARVWLDPRGDLPRGAVDPRHIPATGKGCQIPVMGMDFVGTEYMLVYASAKARSLEVEEKEPSA